MQPVYFFEDVSLLITHYNRSSSLERLLTAFKEIGCQFGAIIVSDDASKPEHITAIQQMQQHFDFNLITTPKNGGLGNNINKGQDAVTTPFTLYVQEDFLPAADFGQHFQDAKKILEHEPTIDMARFYAYFKYPYLKPLSNGFSLMEFAIWKPGYRKFYCYSDHPHLRRSNFFEKFGRYQEGIHSDMTEYRMMQSFLQHKGKAIFYESYRSLFEQKNSSDEPSTVKRKSWQETDHLLVNFLKEIYRPLKFNFDYFFRHF